jgi:pimeloyl-ACP methyl ester carboxylesterase
MATFVLVHGTGCGGWVWQKLYPLLHAAGHEVYTPTLTGLSDRNHLLSCGVNLTTHITDIANLIYFEDLSDVVLVGNSYAGMVITGAAAEIPERLKLLVYLDAYLPDDGQSESDLLPAEVFAARQAEADLHGGVIQPPPPGLFGITNPQLTDWINARMTLHPISTYTEPVPAGDARSKAIPRLIIHCTGNPATTPDLFAHSAAKARANGWPVKDLATGHFAMISDPNGLAAILLEALE